MAQKSGNAIRIEPLDYLIELAAEPIRRDRDPDPNGQMPFNIAMND